MSIQSSFNQVLSLAGVLGALKGKIDKQSAAKTKAAAGTKSMKTEVAETTATDSLTTAQEGKRKTRRNFLNYMKDEPTSLGVTFGQLDHKLQKEIAKNYSSSERKRIMDRKDAEREQK